MLQCYPGLNQGQTLLSPVLVCGPAAATKKLRKPVILSFPHSASLRQGNWTVSVARAESDCQTWSTAVTLGQETLNCPLYAQLDLNTCHLVTEQLAAFALLGSSPGPAAPAFKSLRIAAFAQEFPQGSDLTVRLYCLQDTDHAVRWATSFLQLCPLK